jgi:hypothetical protein
MQGRASPASFQILLVLASGPAHGYAIMLEVTRLTDGGTHLGAGYDIKSSNEIAIGFSIAMPGATEFKHYAGGTVHRVGGATSSRHFSAVSVLG